MAVQTATQMVFHKKGFVIKQWDYISKIVQKTAIGAIGGTGAYATRNVVVQVSQFPIVLCFKLSSEAYTYALREMKKGIEFVELRTAQTENQEQSGL